MRDVGVGKFATFMGQRRSQVCACESNLGRNLLRCPKYDLSNALATVQNVQKNPAQMRDVGVGYFATFMGQRQSQVCACESYLEQNLQR